MIDTNPDPSLEEWFDEMRRDTTAVRTCPLCSERIVHDPPIQNDRLCEAQGDRWIEDAWCASEDCGLTPAITATGRWLEFLSTLTAAYEDELTVAGSADADDRYAQWKEGQ